MPLDIEDLQHFQLRSLQAVAHSRVALIQCIHEKLCVLSFAQTIARSG
jgi:hypothetical protein